MCNYRDWNSEPSIFQPAESSYIDRAKEKIVVCCQNQIKYTDTLRKQNVEFY
jgi:hypothetical protein